ncbi:MAG: hypothetical protein UHS51_02085 [Atopobiaceae bacterium]|nr:hypothetical protein [Atopobiaceae bacterium]
MSNKSSHMASIVVWKDNKVLCCKHDAASAAWEFPSDGIGEGEASMAACKRMAEERLMCRLSTSWLLETLEVERAEASVSMDCFVATLVPGHEPVAEGYAEIGWFGRDELAGMVWQPPHERLAALVGSLWDQVFMYEHL